MVKKRIRRMPKPLPSYSEIVRLYLKEKKSMAEIAELYNVGKPKIRNLIIEYGFEITKRGKWALGETKETHKGIKKSAKAKVGKPRDSETIKKMEPTFFKKGHTTHTKGQQRSEKVKRKISKTLSNKGRPERIKKYHGKDGFLKNKVQHDKLKECPYCFPESSPFVNDTNAYDKKIQRQTGRKTQFKPGNKPHNFGKKPSAEMKEKNRIGHLGQTPHNKNIPRSEWMSAQGEAKVRRAQQNARQNGPTDIEIIMKKNLELAKIKFSEQATKLPGKPDFFISPNIVIFCDGDFDHRNPNSTFAGGRIKYPPDRMIRGKTSKEKWEYDEKITNELKRLGYTVLRFWGEEINKDIEKCLKKIQKTIKA
jgi:DNA mismatch endonuclease, patch repair protein